MGVRRRHAFGLSSAFILIFFFAAAMGGVGITRDKEQDKSSSEKGLEDERWSQAAAVRRLIGPGSSPPTCRMRCGSCFPCRPVHVAIHPGRSFPLEYYPEAWRCKCGDTVFMP